MKTANKHIILQEYLNFWTQDHKVINRRIPALRTHKRPKHIHCSEWNYQLLIWRMEMQRCSSPKDFRDIYFDSKTLNTRRNRFSVFLFCWFYAKSHFVNAQRIQIHTHICRTYLKRMISYNAHWPFICIARRIFNDHFQNVVYSF